MTDKQMVVGFGIVMVIVGVVVIAAGLFLGNIDVPLLIFGAIPTTIGTLVLVRR